MPVTADAVIDALRGVQDPELRRSIVELGMVRDVTVEPDAVGLTLAFTVSEHPRRSEVDDEVRAVLHELVPGVALNISFDVMNDAERTEIRQRLHGDPAATAGTNPVHGHAQGRSVPFADPASTTRVLLIASGKGGVGKSSLTTNLAVALGARGRKVAVVDADVWGFSIPRMLGVERLPVVIDTMLVPPEAYGVRCISMGFFAADDQPVIWRGPMLHKALEQFLTDVFWDDPDYLVVDLPPGTGDISISLAQFLPRAEVFVVTTPQIAAQRVAQRAAFMAQKVNLEVKGVIENMSWFTGDDGKRYQIFGQGGGADLASRLDVTLVGQVPLEIGVREGADAGRPVAALDPGSEAGQAYAAIAERIEVELAPTRRHHPALRVLSS